MVGCESYNLKVVGLTLSWVIIKWLLLELLMVCRQENHIGT